MKNTIKAESGDSAGIKKLVNEIVKERQKIDRCEGDVVAAYVRIARHLAELRQLANKDWGKQLKAIGMHPRVAGRYLKISQHWHDEIGLRESDLLARLPPDLLKLEWLCRVPQVQLGDLAGRARLQESYASSGHCRGSRGAGRRPASQGRGRRGEIRSAFHRPSWKGD